VTGKFLHDKSDLSRESDTSMQEGSPHSPGMHDPHEQEPPEQGARPSAVSLVARLMSSLDEEKARGARSLGGDNILEGLPEAQLSHALWYPPPPPPPPLTRK